MLTKTKKITAFGAIAIVAASAISLGASVGVNADSSKVDINVNIGSILEVDSIETNLPDVTISNLTPGSSDTSGKGSVIVTTNNLKGYYISIKNAKTDHSTALVNSSSSSYTIPTLSTAGYSTIDAAHTAGVAAWGLKCNSSDVTYATGTDTIASTSYSLQACNDSWFSVPADNATQGVIISTGDISAPISDATTTFTYGVTTASNQAAGTYQTSINYIITART